VRWFVVRAALLAAASLVAACGRSPVQPGPPPPPSLTCPANLTLTGVLGGSQSVTYPTPVPSGGSAPVLAGCAPPSGGLFPTGTTVVTCTATDALSRQASCSFTVTLQAQVLAARRFVAFGDSVTAGEDGRRLQLRFGFIDPVRAYPAVLQSILQTDFPDQGASVFNEGLSGVRATADLARLPGVLQARQPDVLLLLHGYNDLLSDGLAAVEPVASAIREYLRIARARGVQHVFVSTLTPSRPATGQFNRRIDPRAIQETNVRVAQVVMAEGARLVNAYDAFAGRELELVEADGLHLTAAGNQVLAETFYAAIRAAGLTAPALRWTASPPAAGARLSGSAAPVARW
jgi:lysophospholipase L1-like esterase